MLVSEPRPYVLASMRLGALPGLRQALPGYLHNARAEVEGRRAQIGPLFARLKDLKVPVSVLHGDLDTLVPLSAAQELCSYLGPDHEFELIRGGTHYLELQYPKRLYQAIRRLIARIESGGE